MVARILESLVVGRGKEICIRNCAKRNKNCVHISILAFDHWNIDEPELWPTKTGSVQTENIYIYILSVYR